jgi:hypothetical protein
MKTSCALAIGLSPLLLAVALGGCTNVDPTRGYTMVSQYRPGIRTVAVPIWARARGEYRRDLEIALTEAICKRIESDTPYKVADKSRADTLLSGTLGEVEQRVLSVDPHTGFAREIQVRLLVDFTWKDLRTGEVLAEKKGFGATTEYIPPEPLAEDFFVGSRDALDRIAQRIVEQLRNPW